MPCEMAAVRNFARKAAQLNKKVKKGELRTFNSITQEEHDAIVTLQEKLLSASFLSLSSSQELLNLEKGVCDKQMGCVLMH